MAENLLPHNLLQTLEEKVTTLLIHLDEAREANQRLEREVAQLKTERDNNTKKLKSILDLLDETENVNGHTIAMNTDASAEAEEAEEA